MNRRKIIVAAAVFYYSFSAAQDSQYFSDRQQYTYNLAGNLYQTRIYNAAQYEYAQQYFYNQTLEASQKEAAQFFDQVIGVMLQKNHAEQGLAAFIKEYPRSSFFAQANLPLADYYLAQKDFPKALETLEKVNQYQLSRRENQDYILKLGYAKFMTGDSKGAVQALEEVYQSGNAENKSEVAYMLGHLHYAERRHEQAFQYFDSIKDDGKFARLVRPYYVQMYYNEKDYDMAVSEGRQLLTEPDISEAYKAEVHKIMGESFFMKQNYTEAYPHLKSFVESKENPSESDLYQMGFVAAQLQKYDEAVSYYNQLINSNSALSQNAYYQLGNAYIQTGQKQEALSAYRSAYQMSYDSQVQKLAHEQYAKLSYDIGNPFDAAPKVIQEYIDNYPGDAKTPAMKSLLVKSYLYSGDFKETLAAIDKLPDSTPETDKIDQEVSYMLGTEEFNKGNFDAAEQYFQRSLEYNLNTEFNLRAQYWLGQTHYQKGNYTGAVSAYEGLLNAGTFPEKQQLPYDLGYAYFKNKDFAQAQQYFAEYLKNPKADFKNDAELRLADTHYANNELDEAVAIYDQSETMDDYTVFQKGMALGFQGKGNEKIAALKGLISQYPNSDYADDAQYEIGVTYASLADYASANDYFGRVINKSADKDLVANAQIYRAQNYIDQNDDSKALSELQSLGNQYRNTAYASKVVQAARPLFLKTGDVSGYQEFASSFGVRLDASELDEINLSSAKQFYTKKDYKNAIPLYEKYLSQNPTGEGLYQAQFELGESYYQTKNTTKAVLVLQDVAGVQNDYQQEAQTRITQIFLAQGDTAAAKPYLIALADAGNVNIRNYALVELMNIYAGEKNFKEAEKLADQVLTNTKNAPAVLESAKVIKARSLMNSGKDKDAQSAYTSLEKSSNAAVAAEALFAKAYFQNKAKSYKASNETIFKLANNYAAEEYWGARALVVMARNYIGLKDNYQASYTVDQLIANYQDFPDVVAEAKEVKKLIK